MNILITGADGFIGSHLVDYLIKKNHKITALSYYNSFNNLGWLNGKKNKNLKILSGDIRDQDYCLKITKNKDVIFNLAAIISIPYSYLSYQNCFETNTQGAYNICLGALKNKVAKVIQLSTSEVYGTAEYTPIDENHPKKAQSPYSASKIASDAIADSFHYTYDMDITIARPFNTYGPRQSLRAIIPTIITQMINNKVVKLGNISTKRDFTHVTDTCRGLYLLMKSKRTKGEVFNIGSTKYYSIKQIFDTLKSVTGSNVKLEIDKKRFRPDNSEVQILSCNYNKLKKVTGFAPQISFKDGLRETVKWFRDNPNIYSRHNIYNI